jgi:phage/plasmid-like protein (TIGR03299 family)
MHAIETFGKQAAFASLRVTPWHNLGTVFDTPVPTEKMLELSHLGGWNLRLADAAETTGVDFARPQQFVMRDNPFTGSPEVLGVVGGRYTLLTNEDAFSFLSSLTGNLRWETAGSLKGGTTIFATMADVDELVLDPSGQADTIRRYFMITTSHDGTGQVLITEVYLRVVCANTLAVAVANHGPSVRVRHTAKMADRMKAGAEAIGMLSPHRDAMDDALRAMIETELTKDAFFKIVSKDLIPAKGDSKAAITRRENQLDAVMNIWAGGTGGTSNLENNVFKGWQTMNEFNTWGRQARGIDTPAGQENFFMAVSGLDAATQADDQFAFNRFLALTA